MDLVSSRSCGCSPGFVYATQQTFLAHFKSNKHLLYQQVRTEHDLRIQLGLRDKEIAVLQRRLADCEATLQVAQEPYPRKRAIKTRDELKREVQILIEQIKAIQSA